VNINLFFRRLKLVPGWLRDASTLWRFVFGVAIICVSVDWVGYWLRLDRIDRLPYEGWILELLGLTLVAFDLAKKLELFDQTSVVGRALEWFGRFPLFNQDQVVVVGAAHFAIEGATLSARGKIKVKEGATTEEKVEFLMRQVDNIDDRIHDLRVQIKTGIEDGLEGIEKRISNIEEEIAAVQSQAVKAHVGDISLEVVGLGWILIGLTLATVPDFVLWLFGPIIVILQL